jgi:hypothetical protein
MKIIRPNSLFKLKELLKFILKLSQNSILFNKYKINFFKILILTLKLLKCFMIRQIVKNKKKIYLREE